MYTYVYTYIYMKAGACHVFMAFEGARYPLLIWGTLKSNYACENLDYRSLHKTSDYIFCNNHKIYSSMLTGNLVLS